MPILLDLFITFAKVGGMTFGGGYAMLPILQREIVDKKGWATSDQLADYYAVGQCTPGVIAVNTATFVGSQQAGIAGGIVATLGVVSLSTLIIIIVALFLSNFMQMDIVVHAFNGVRAGVTALILSSVVKLFKNSVTDWPTRIIYIVVLGLAACGSFMKTPEGIEQIWDVITSPVFLVLAAGITGLAVRASRGDLKKADLNTKGTEKADLNTKDSNEADLNTQDADKTDLNTRNSNEADLNTQDSGRAGLNTKDSEKGGAEK